jgi:hypothetical protein
LAGFGKHPFSLFIPSSRPKTFAYHALEISPDNPNSASNGARIERYLTNESTGSLGWIKNMNTPF